MSDPMDELVERIMREGDWTLDAFAEGRKVGAFFAGCKSAAEDMRQPLTLSAAVALTETWMVGDAFIDCDEDEADDE